MVENFTNNSRLFEKFLADIFNDTCIGSCSFLKLTTASAFDKIDDMRSEEAQFYGPFCDIHIVYGFTLLEKKSA